MFILLGSRNHAAVTTKDQMHFMLVDLKTWKCSDLIRGFQPFMDQGILRFRLLIL